MEYIRMTLRTLSCWISWTAAMTGSFQHLLFKRDPESASRMNTDNYFHPLWLVIHRPQVTSSIKSSSFVLLNG
ncbi:MAG TPA: hypothetical protein PL073_06695 [Spirochaetota bacterium]|nr:hypothetical protein [Spirochaetota bacterium]